MAFRPACSEMGFALHSGPLSSRSTTQRHRAHPASSSLTVLPVLLKQCMYWDSPSGLRSTLFGLKLIIAACCWAVSAVISRSFAVEQLRAMVPLADIFNHKPASEASRALDNESGPAVAWSLSEDGERFEVRAREDVAPGKEVRICYGEESAAEILAVHGMILSENEADYLEIFESGEDLLAAVETLSGHPRGDRAKLMEASLSPDDVLLRPTLEASEPLLRALEVSLCEDEELPDVPGEMLLPVCSPERLSALRLQALLFLTQILRGALRAMKDVPETSLGDAGPRQLAARYRGHIKDMLANLISSAEVEMSVELSASRGTTQKQKAALSISLGWGCFGGASVQSATMEGPIIAEFSSLNALNYKAAPQFFTEGLRPGHLTDRSYDRPRGEDVGRLEQIRPFEKL
eukprot:s212_g30.t2